MQTSCQVSLRVILDFFISRILHKKIENHSCLLISVMEKSRKILCSPINVIIKISLQCFHLTGYIICHENDEKLRTKSIDQIPLSRSKTEKNKNTTYKQF